MLSTVFSVVIAIFAAYAVSPVPVPRPSASSPATVLSTQMFPGILFLLPLFLIFVNIDNGAGLHAALPDPARA